MKRKLKSTIGEGMETTVKFLRPSFNNAPYMLRPKKMYEAFARVPKSADICVSVTKNWDEIDYFNNLPDEIILKIMSYLSEKELCRLASVNRRLCAISNDEDLWKKLYKVVYEYDRPLVRISPKKFKFVSSESRKWMNPWKKSYEHLYAGIHIGRKFQDGYPSENEDGFYWRMSFVIVLERVLRYADEKRENLEVFFHNAYDPRREVLDCSNMRTIHSEKNRSKVTIFVIR